MAEKGILSEKRRVNVRLNEYKYRDESGIEYTLVTETRKNGEVFNDFIQTKKHQNKPRRYPKVTRLLAHGQMFLMLNSLAKILQILLLTKNQTLI